MINTSILHIEGSKVIVMNTKDKHTIAFQLLSGLAYDKLDSRIHRYVNLAMIDALVKTYAPDDLPNSIDEMGEVVFEKMLPLLSRSATTLAQGHGRTHRATGGTEKL